MRLARRHAIRLVYININNAQDNPKYLPKTKRALPTGFDNTAYAVPDRISRATEDEAQRTAPKSPVTKETARRLVFTI